MEDRMDKEFLGDRRRALEEEYFAKLNRALLERLRAAEAANGEAGDAHERREADEDAPSDRPATEASAAIR
jgi:hypothetical protein